MLKNVITTILVAALVSVLILSLNKGAPSMPTTDTTLGSQIETTKIGLGAGADVSANPLDGGLIFKNTLTIPAPTASLSLTAKQIVGNNTISVVQALPTLSITLPLATDFPASFLPRAGDRTEILYLSATTTTGNNAISGFVGSTGSTVTTASTTPVTTASTTGTLAIRIQIVRKAGGTLLFMLSPFK